MTRPRRPGVAELRWLLPVPVFVVASMGSNHSGGGPEVAQAGLATLAAAAMLPLAGRWPRAAVLVNGLAVGVYLTAGLANGPIFLTVPLTAFVAAQRARPRVLLPVLAAALAAVWLGLGLRAGLWSALWVGRRVGRRVGTDDESWLVAVWQAVGVGALALGACALGWWWADRRAARQAQARQAATEERLRMARDLHDGVGHGLAVIAMQAGVALHVLDRDPGQARVSLEAIRDTSRESLDVLRAELARITGMPGERRPAPGIADLEPLVERIRRGGLHVVLRLDLADPAAVPDEAGRTVYSVVQESLTNVLRHAQAQRATVTVRAAGTSRPALLEVTVVDDGRAAAGRPQASGQGRAQAPAERPGPVGTGIAGMRARLERLGGELEAGPVAGSGFRVRAVLPLPAEPPARGAAPAARGEGG